MRASTWLLAALVFLSACMVGKTGRDYSPAKGPAGANVSLRLTDRRAIAGELLAVEERTLLILQGREITRVALRLIKEGKAPPGRFQGRLMTGEVRERLRLISRYPQGVSAELEGRLLQAYGTSAVREIT